MAGKTTNNGFSVNLLPKIYQTNANKKFLQSTVDQLYQPGTLTKTSGYIGRKNAKASVGTDICVPAADQTRQNYQLEPALTITDTLGNVTFFKDYLDYTNQIGVFGGNTSNHARLNSQEFYSWDPHIEWDKFINFQNYYWLPYGPDTITVYGDKQAIISTYSVELQQEGSNNQYVFTPNGFTPNPVLKLYKGQTYTFSINSPGNPFSIKTARSTGVNDRYVFLNAVDNYGVESGSITFTIPIDAPEILYYQSENDVNLGGMIQIYSSLDDTSISVEAEILGKSKYTLPGGTALSNGMKLTFAGNVTPSKYAVGEYYVEGVGTAIKLVPASSLEIISSYTTNTEIEFESVPFDAEPFDTAAGFAGQVDYIVINRASQDRNPWSRYNRWFHKDVINASATYNNAVASLDQTVRAKRPIIEFQADLKLFNLGTVSNLDIDLVDDFTVDAFLTIEGSSGYNVDGVQLTPGMLVLFTNETDPLVQNKIFQVQYVDVKHLTSGSKQLHLVEYAEPFLNQVVLVKQGITNQGTMYWYDGSKWNQGQLKTKVNQPPMFDVVDNTGTSFGDSSVYVGTTFKGTAIFSYPGSLPNASAGFNDTVLGFPLTYLNVNNIGDIVFNFNLVTDTFSYKKSAILETQNIDIGYLSSLDYNKNTVYVNGWQKCITPVVQAAVRIYDNSGLTNNFNIDIFDDINNLSDLTIKIYVNGIFLDSDSYSVVKTTTYYQVVLDTSIQLTDILTIKAFTAQPVNSNGFYEIPLNLQNNPLNDVIGSFTLGEVADHLNTIMENIDPDSTALRDSGNVTPYGTKFVQHSGPLSLAVYHLTSESNNIIKALEQSRNDYNNFKRLFLTTASNLGVHGDPVKLVDIILQQINASKPKVAPYYLSDMVPYGPATVATLTVVDYRIKNYPLSAVFSLDVLSNKAVGVYHNGVQMVYGRDYTFSPQGFVIINSSVALANNDSITIYEYESTDGSFVPATPTKLGMWPSFVPQLYLDTSLVNPVNVIQGHDGSIIAAYNDYRDDLILELEKRIFNNIKVKYDTDIFDIKEIIPSYARKTDYSVSEFNSVLSPNFYNWVGLVGKDLTTPLNYDRTNSFTFNFSLNTAPDGTALPGYWRGVYRWLLDTDRPNLTPWEMLGFSIEPSWWTDLYGPAPYTSDNIPMWTDLANGVIREPGMPAVVNANFIRPFLLNHLPVDESGNLISPLDSGLATGSVQPSINNNFVFGDISPVENAWRRSSYYSFSVIATAILLKPAYAFGTLLDRSRVVRNVAGQLIYADTGLRIRPADVVLPSVYSSSTRVQTAGLVNYIVDLIFNYIFSNDVAAYNFYESDLKSIDIQLSYRVGAFTNQDQFNLLLESKTPNSTGNVFIPAENYKVFLNKSSSVEKLTYSGVIITKVSTGFEVKGYSITQPYFKYYQYTSTGTTINVGGISESYVNWASAQQYTPGTVVLNNGIYYRATSNVTSGPTFDATYFTALPSLPMQGGTSASLRTAWDTTEAINVPYGTLFATAQEVVDFLLGYGEYLKSQGFVFDSYNNNYHTVSNWETSAKEFLFWTTQNWSTGQDKWSDWQPNQKYSYSSIVRYDGDYYSALYNLPATDEFDFTKWNLLPGLSNVGSSVISLSPSANAINFITNLTVVDSITNSFNPYEIFKVDGTPFEVSTLDSYRVGNSVTYTSKTNDGIYGASFYLVQNEHVIIIDNNTIFNDLIYNPTSGYRRERLKISGYVTNGWYGGLDIPGFVFDSANINAWQPWQDYNVGDVVSFQSYYYSANDFIAGAPVFTNTSWVKLPSKPTPQILPNWTNIATQFVDFYSLDVDSFNTAQQTMAQHLIGYQKRQYLENIIQDPVSEFKFYQGMIREKGTQNVLNHLFGVLNSENKESLTFYEEWAIRVGQYGASNAFEDVEFTLNQGQFLNNPQGTVLVGKIDKTINPFIIQQVPSDLYVAPKGYSSKPFPVLSETNQYLRDAGYVNSSDVFSSIGSLADLVSQPATEIVVGIGYKIITTGTTDFTSIGASKNTVGSTFVATGNGTGTGTVQIDISQVTEGSYFWCSFDGPTSWNVYRFTDVKIRVTNVTSAKDVITVTTQDSIDLPVGSYVGLAQVDVLDGFYQITSVNLNSFTISAPGVKVPNPFTQQQNLVVYALVSQRTASIDTIDQILPQKLQSGNFVWTDDAGNGSWASWIYNPVYSATTLNASTPQSLLNFGNVVAINKIGTEAAVSIGTTKFAIYDKISPAIPWTQRQILQPPVNNVTVSSSLTPVSVIAFSPDGTWMVTGSPTVSNSSTYFKGTYSAIVSYVLGDIVSYNNAYYKALFAVPMGTTPSQLSGFWNEIFYIPIGDLTPTQTPYSTGITNNGIITLYRKDANNIYQFVDSILSPNISSENFGSNIIFDSSNIYISAVGHATNTGVVYKISYATTPQVTAIYDDVNSSGIILNVTSTKGVSAGMTLSGTDRFGNSAWNNGQIVESVITRLLFPPTGPASNSIYNISSTSIPLLSIPKETNGVGYATVGGTRYSFVFNIYNTGLTSVNVLVTSKSFLSGGAPGSNVFFVTSNSNLAIGQLIVGSGVPTGSYIGAINFVNSSYQITVVDFTGAIQNFITQGAGTYEFYNVTTYAFVDVTSTKGLDPVSLGATISTVEFNNDSILTFNVLQVQAANSVILSTAPDLTPYQSITFSSTGWQYAGTVGTGPSVNSYFGNQLALSSDGSTLVVSYFVSQLGVVNIYKSGSLIQTLTGVDNSFGQGIAVSDDGTYIAISDDLQSTVKVSQQGTVGVYAYNPLTNLYVNYQSITDHSPEVNGEFGSKIAFMNDSQTLVIYSQNGSSKITTTFDSVGTTFDKQSTTFITTQVANGRVDIHDNYNNNWVYSESLLNSDSVNSGYGQGFAVGNNAIFVSAPYTTIAPYTNVGQVNLYLKPRNALSWSVYRTASEVADLSKIKKAFLYNKSSNQLITYLDVIDPIQGKIAGPAEEEITYQTFYDPATYSYSDGTSQVTVNTNGFWGTNQLGQLWWNLQTAKFVNPYFTDPAYRNNTWNTLAPGASIDIYEWVSSSLLPSQWDTQSNTAAGIAAGVTGKTLYGDSAYCVTKTYNSVTKTFKNTYYYWVANKTTTPAIPGRNISAQAVSSLIANPKGQAYSYLALLGPDSFSLANISQYLNNSDVVLAVEYWTVNKIDRNIHSQWKLISTDTIVDLPKTVQQKWIDSLCGIDIAGRPVPDSTLPVKLQYGIENRPRQSMFVNRVEALKEYIEGLNALLLSTQLIGNYDLSKLESFDVPPAYTGSTINGNLFVPGGEFDQIIDTDTAIEFTNINLFVRPELAPIITNGKITGVSIISTGRGYLQAPYIKIIGTGKGAVVKAVIDSIGRVSSIDVISSGHGYDDSTTAIIRDYSVLVLSDSQAGGAWSIYAFNPAFYDVNTKTVTGKWSRTLTKSYDVRDYWSYVDWYATGYNQFTAPDYAVQTFVDLNFISPKVGDIVKILTVNTGGWLLLEKYANSSSTDWTLSYKTIAMQNGTIQFNSSLYETSTSAVGYDSSIFDDSGFDVKAALELRIILETLQENILIDSLYENYLDLFFRSIKYALSEQIYVDWIFKTSFVRATHNVGALSQPVYYPVDNLSNFQDYVSEVKPYRTKVREYISQYVGTGTPNGVDLADTPVTDFDLPATIVNNALTVINATVVDGKITSDINAITTYPWKFWLDNVGFTITELIIVSGGSGYVTQPTVVFDSNSGSGASANVFFTNGVINRVILKSPGSGFLSAPTVTVVGGLAVGGTPARLVAVIGDSVVRSNLLGMKFDRIGQKPLIGSMDVTETFPGTGSTTLSLAWAPDIRYGKSTVTIVDNTYNTTVPVLREDYTLSVVESKSSGFTQYSGKIKFNFIISESQTVTIKYTKDISVLDAVERINFYYDPISGMPGKDPAQLMTGVDYGGAVVGNLGFTASGGWANLPFGTDSWGLVDSKYTDYKMLFPFSGGTDDYHTVMPTIFPEGTIIDVYYSPLSVTSTLITPDIYDANTTIFYYNYQVNPTVYFTSTSTTIGGTSITTTAQGTTYPVGIIVLTALQATGGTSGQQSITFDSVTDIVAGQYVSGYGVPYGTYVSFVQDNVVSLSANLNLSTTFSGYISGTTLTVTTSPSLPITVGSVISGSGISTGTTILEQMGSSSGGIGTYTISTSASAGSISSPISITAQTIASGYYSFFNLGTTLTVSSTVGVLIGMGVVGTGFTTQSVVKIIDAHNVVLSSPPVSIPTIGETLKFVENTAGSTQLSVVYSSNIQEGDIVTCDVAGYTFAFGHNTTITSVSSSAGKTLITLSQIFYSNIPDGVAITFTRNLTAPTDYLSGVLSVIFSEPPPIGVTVYIYGYVDPIKIDAADFDMNTMSSPTNQYAVMPPIVSDGLTGVVYIPSTIPGFPNVGDKFIFREESSDGSFSVLGQDSNLSGGDLAYSTALGINADDIILDGDGFNTTMSSPAPEEVVPGQVVDTLAIKVFDRIPSGSANIKVDNYVTDGTKFEFPVSVPMTTPRGVIVKLDGSIKTYGVDYETDFENQQIVLTSVPSADKILSIFVISYAGDNILDIDSFVGDGTTTEFVTQSPWFSNITAGVFENGIPSTVVLFETDSSYVSVNSVGIRFAVAPAVGVLINYIIVKGSTQSFAITNAETITAHGGATYTLQNIIGNSLPDESYMIVRVNNTILSAPVNSYFTVIAGQTQYVVDSNKIAPFSVPAYNVSVLIDNNLLLAGRDYSVDLSGITITITNTILNSYIGKELIVSVLLTTGYSYNASTRQITFTEIYTPGTAIEIISSYQHDSIDLERTNISINSTSNLTANSPEFYRVSASEGGLLVLERAVTNENYVWVIQNGNLLVPGVDYRLNEDHITIQLSAMPSVSDRIELLTFGSTVLTPAIAYVQFKDMLNNTTYSRLSLNKRTTLAQDLNWSDTTIVLEDGSNFQEPNAAHNLPGLIEIQGERIHYFAKTGNVLSQLRRGVLGTGIAKYNLAGTYVQDISSSETIPYTDTVTVSTILSNGTGIIQLDVYEPFEATLSNGTIGLAGNLLTVTTPPAIPITIGSTITSASVYLPSGTKVTSQISGTAGGVGVYEINYSAVLGTETFYTTPGAVPVKGSSSDSTGVVAWFTSRGYTFGSTYSSSIAYSVNTVVIYENNYYYCIQSVPVLSNRKYGIDYSPATTTTIVGVQTPYWALYPTSIVPGRGQTDQIEVFVGGYAEAGDWIANIVYSQGTIVNVGGYTYQCIQDNIGGSNFFDAVTIVTINANGTTTTVQTDAEYSVCWKFFVGNIRLKKAPFSVFNVNQAPYSPAGDVKFDADFSVDGTLPLVYLTNNLPTSTQVTVVQRTGSVWDSYTNILYDDSKVANFIKAEQGIEYAEYYRAGKKY